MFIQTVKTQGVAHLSYVVGNNGIACVIDPRRDIDCYLDIARQQECRIQYIFETHRNEDIISGSAPLAKRTGAEVFHGPHVDGRVEYAKTATEGHDYPLGQLKIKVLETPGHTKDSLSFLLFDDEFAKGPVAIFTGDALFVGDVGRTDFYPDEAESVAGMLYDSLQKIRAFSTAQLYPAHGAGSVCGDGMAEREFSTVAHEFDNNPRLQLSRQAFIKFKLNEHHYQPPYFAQMEQVNLTGPNVLPDIQATPHLSMSEVLTQQDQHKLIDIRAVDAHRAAHLANSWCFPAGMISAYAGWLLNPTDSFILLAENPKQAADAQLEFSRIGFDNCKAYSTFSMPELAASGHEFNSFSSISTDTVKQRLQNAKEWMLLDVRKKTEVAQASIKGAEHIFLGKLIDQLPQLDKSKHYTLMCGSGVRATVAASVLANHGFEQLDVYLGSMSAWKNSELPTLS